jgi:hypothetical protein
MRLAQIARKVGMTPNDIKRFLEDEFEINIGKEPNFKLNEIQINSVLEKFPVVETVQIESSSNQENNKENYVQAAISENDLADELDEFIAQTITDQTIVEHYPENIPLIEAEIEEKVSEPMIEEPIAKKNVVIINYEDTGSGSSDETSFIEVPINPDAEIIKAPTIKLDGLKILGKIELPEHNKVESPTIEDVQEKSEDDQLAALDAAMLSQVQDIKTGKIVQPTEKIIEENLPVSEDEDSIYKDENGIYHFTPQQKANRQKRLYEIERTKKIKAEQEKKKRHYEEKMRLKELKKVQNNQPIQDKKKPESTNKPGENRRSEKKQPIEPPKGLWKKFLYWLNDN